MIWRRKKQLVVVLATRHPQAPAALEEAVTHLDKVQLERREALSCDGAYRALEGAHLAVVDLDALTGVDDGTSDYLLSALGSDGLVTVSGSAFVSDPVGVLERAVAAVGLGTMLPPRSVAFTAWAGGVGKTTLALAAARAFHAATGLPAAVIELAPGPSALKAVLDIDGHDVYQVVSQNGAYPVWEGVTLALMNWPTAQLLTREQIEGHWRALAEEHVFVAYDVPALHPLADLAKVEQIYVLADHRPDAQVEAVALAQRLRDDGQPEETVRLGLNQGGVGGRLALPEPAAFALKTSRRPLDVGGSVLKAVYPGWRQ